MKYVLGTAAVAAAMALSAPAYATLIPTGTVGVAVNSVPTVHLDTSPATFTATNGETKETFGTGAFADVANKYGWLNGTVQFSKTVGATLAESIADFFVFDDGHGGTYNFSVTSVNTLSYSVTPSQTALALVLLGTTVNTNLGYDPTATSFTLSFNSTHKSPWSASATLGVDSVPEPTSWALMLGGFGLIGGVLRTTRKKTSVVFA
jgi:hypothetical protein